MVLLAIARLCTSAPLTAAEQPKKVIYETDMCLDVDDVGGLAILHALADKGEVEILAVTFNEVHPSGAAAIDAINTWYGRGGIPVGICKGNLAAPDTSKYLGPVAAFPHDLAGETAPTALEVYRKVLAEQPDKSVTIISVGFLNNIYDLLKAEPDLVGKKVKELVVMGGRNNDDFNLSRHDLVAQSEYVIRHWPTPLVISSHGGGTKTGGRLSGTAAGNPVREAYYQWFDQSYQGRSSWDQVAVLYGVRGLRNYFSEVVTGTGRLRNGFEWQMQPGHRSSLEPKLSDQEFVDIIEPLMIQPPRKQLAAGMDRADGSRRGAAGINLQAVEQWGVFETSFKAQPPAGSPMDVKFSATFKQASPSITVAGFWDGRNTFKVRFSPPATGEWKFTTTSQAAGLNGKTGAFTATKPAGGNHGPVEVFDTLYLRYTDGTPFHQFGTTCYAWTHQMPATAKPTSTRKTSSGGPRAASCTARARSASSG
jgi:hypothetical protein